jgi:uncharacterized membrane protein YjgN (DUF898 family)
VVFTWNFNKDIIMSQSYSGGSDSVDYSSYSLDELKQAFNSLDKELFPEQTAILAGLIAQREPVVSAQPEQDQVLTKSRVKFFGTGSEFFSIWIVNLLLSIVTLGIYSAWATVRTNRYFYSNTEIAGHRLAYLATPIQILVGRVIAFSLFVIVLIASTFSPIVAVITTLIIAAATPMIIVMGVRFRMRMMAYRNVRFDFTKRFGRAYLVFFVFPVLAVLSLYIALPWVLKKMDDFLYENMTYGDKQFTPDLRAGEYYVAAIIAGVIMFAGVMIFALVAGIGVAAGAASSGEAGAMAGVTVASVIGVLAYVFALLIGYSFYSAYIRNHVYNNMRIQNVAVFSSDLKVMDLVMLSATNFLMMIFTLGIAYPWVKVRTTRLLTNATEISILKGIDSVIATSGGADSAIADEVIGAFDIDVSLG